MIASRSLGIFAGIIAVLIWGLTPVLTKLGIAGISPINFLIIRYGLSTALLIPILKTVKRQIFTNDKRVLLFFFAIAIHLSSFTYSLKNLPVSWYILLFSLSPIASLFFIKAKLTPRSILYIVVGAAGALCFLSDKFLANFHFKSFVALLISISSWIYITVQIKWLQNSFSDKQITSIGNLATFLTSVPIWLASGANIPELSSKNWIVIASLAVIVPLGFYLFSLAIRIFPVFGITSQYLELVFGLLFSHLIFQEPLTPIHLFGAALVILSLLGISTQKNVEPNE